MSSPLQPAPGSNRPGLARQLAILLAVVVLAAGSLYLLASNYAHNRDDPQAMATAKVVAIAPSPTVDPPIVDPPATATPGRGGGVSSPLHPAATPTIAPSDTPDPPVPTSTEQAPTATGTATVAPTSTPLPPAMQSLAVIDAAPVPVRDLYSLTARLMHKALGDVPHTTNRPPGNFKVGHSDTFYLSDVVAKRYYTVTATIKQVTNHAYFYVENDTHIDQSIIDTASNVFDTSIYPTDKALFGSEWTPGVDNDPRITVLFAPLQGVGGYFSSADEYTRAVNPYSNEREIIYINSDTDAAGIESVLAHEFQHMIHWHESANHDVWLNEGASELAMVLNGYNAGGVDNDFMQSPGIQLNSWGATPGESFPHYGAAYLFLDYLRTHYGGDQIIRSIVSAKGQGDNAVDNALASLGYTERFDDVFKKWVLANLLSGLPGAGKIGEDYPDRQVAIAPQIVAKQYPLDQTAQVSQFGATYVQLPATRSGKLSVNFSGQPNIGVIPAPAHSGSGIWWSNRGDMSDMTMTRQFDLSGVRSATLSYYIWFDIEDSIDYAYAEVSTDGGTTWNTLKGKYTTNDNPNGTNYGNGYTGRSATVPGAGANGWLHETLNLGAYAGKKVLLRFEYVTDDGYNASGVALDDITIAETGFKDDAEQNNGWQGEGFVRVADTLPQRYYLAVVKMGKESFDVQPVEVDASGKASFTIEGLVDGGQYDKAILVISGMTPHIIQPATYRLQVVAEK